MVMILLRKEDLLVFYKDKEKGLKSIEKHSDWFPLYSSACLAGIVGDLIADGHIQGDPKWRIDFTSKNLNKLNSFGNKIFRLFGIKGKIRPCTTNKWGKSFNYGINCKLLARIIHLIGVPTGNKVKKKFLIPKWILSKEEYFVEFVREIFSCDGYVDIYAKNL